MKIIPIRCTNCGADLEIEEGRNECYCNFCGHHMFIDNEVKETIHRNIDEARILEAQIRLKELEQEDIDSYYLNKYKFSKMVLLMTFVPWIIYEVMKASDPNAGIGIGIIIIAIYLWIIKKKYFL